MNSHAEKQSTFYNKDFKRISRPWMDDNISDFYVEKLASILLTHGYKNELSLQAFEIGVGEGRVMSKMVKRFPHWTFKGIDISQKNITKAQAQNLNVTLGDANDLSSRTKFDMIYGTAILHHLENIPHFFADIHKMLTQNGILLFGPEPVFYEFFYIIYHKIRGSWDIERGMMNISKTKIYRELSVNFKNIKIYRHGNPFVYFSKKLGYFWNRTYLSRIPFLNDIYIYAERK